MATGSLGGRVSPGGWSSLNHSRPLPRRSPMCGRSTRGQRSDRDYTPRLNAKNLKLNPRRQSVTG